MQCVGTKFIFGKGKKCERDQSEKRGSLNYCEKEEARQNDKMYRGKP